MLVIAAVLGLGWLLGVSPLLTQASAADMDRISVEQNNQAQVIALGQMKADFGRLSELEAQIDTLKLSIPNEVDSDFLYAYLSRIAGGSSIVKDIHTGEAQVYGSPTTSDGAAPAAPTAPADPTATPAPVPGVANLYTVPVTITFRKEASGADVLAYAGLMQNGPRIFVITNISRDPGPDSSGTITAYMFVISNVDDTPGTSAGTHENVLSDLTIPVISPWGPTSAPAPSGTPTPNPTGGATPAPTP